MRRAKAARRAAAAIGLAFVAVTSAGGSELAAPPGAASCSGCHARAQGVSAKVPPMFGRTADNIVEAMQAYRRGEREPTVMDRIAKGFSDGETRAIAVWIAAQAPEGARP